MRDILFAPAVVEVVAGDRVTWTNRDDVPHDAVGNGWATPLLDRDQSASVRFIAAGTFDYVCSIHPTMTGRVEVRAAPAGGGGGAATQPPTDAEPDARPAPAVGGGIAMLLVALASAACLALRPVRRRARGG
jgi:hypothetical protein